MMEFKSDLMYNENENGSIPRIMSHAKHKRTTKNQHREGTEGYSR